MVARWLLSPQEERNAFLEWVHYVDFTPVNEEITSKRFGDTGSWLLRSVVFKEWLDKSSPNILWLNGRFGTGKSVLASLAIKHLIDRDYSAKDAVVYAYFKDGSGSSQYEPAQVMSSLLKQLCWNLQELPDPVARLYRDYSLDARSPTFGELKALFYDCLRFFDCVFIVLDGLDACEGRCRKEILKLVCEYGDSSNNLKILVTSRRDMDIVLTFRQPRILHVRVENPSVAKDIEKVVKHRVTTELGHINAELQEYVIETLAKSSNGVHLLAEIQLNCLAHIPEPDIKRYLESNPCPTELEDVYRSLFWKMNRLPKMTKKLAQDCLLWTLHSKNGLYSGAFIDAVSLENKSSTEPGGPYDADTLNDVTFGLLKISDLNVIRVKPIHSSLQTFISHPTTPHSKEMQDFFLEKSTANAKLAIVCLRHLMLDIEPPDCWDTCLFYCARYFDSHIRSTLNLPGDLKVLLTQMLFAKPEAYLKRIMAWRFTAHEYEYPKVTCIGNPKVIDPVVFLDCVSLPCLKESFIGHQGHKLAQSWRFWPKDCYFLAAALGFSDILRELICNGMDVNQATDRYTALHCAIRGISADYSQRKSVIKFLLDAGADWNFDSRYDPSELPVECYETPLNTALSHHVESAVETIVGHYSFNFAEWMKTVPQKHPDWIRIMVKHGAKIEQTDRDCTTALEVAKSLERQDCVRVLQELGASE